MREHGIPADLMTIDCLKSGKRILVMVHDSQPEITNFQFCRNDEDSADEFQSIAIESLTAQTLLMDEEHLFNSSSEEAM